MYVLLLIDRAAFDNAIEVFETYDDQGLRFTDPRLLLLERCKVDRMRTVDDEFDGIIERLDPAEIS